MDYEEKILEREQDAREEGKEEGLKRSVKMLVSSLKRAGNTKQETMHLPEQKDGYDYSDDQLENFLKKS